jgi:hypothetical protein
VGRDIISSFFYDQSVQFGKNSEVNIPYPNYYFEWGIYMKFGLLYFLKLEGKGRDGFYQILHGTKN